MPKLSFQVQGSASEPYKVAFNFSNNNLTAACDCNAGQMGTYCKHRLSILQNDFSSIVSPNKNDANTVLQWLKNTPLETVLLQLQQAEKELALSKKKVENFKKQLSTFMNFDY